MRCQKVKEKLTGYLAGECLPSECRILERHLNNCLACRSMLEELKQLDLYLNLWEPESSPPDLKAGVLRVLGEYPGIRGEPSVFQCIFRPVVLRDLVAAAVVALAVFWAGASWFVFSNFNQAGKNINYAANIYTHAVGDKMELAAAIAGKYSSKFFIKELKPSEMYKSPGY